MEADTPRQTPVSILNQLRDSLLRLHKELLDSERDAYERDVARIATPGQFLGLVMDDPWFAYLRELSGLVARIDESVDDRKQPATYDDVKHYLQQSSVLLMPSEFGQGFGKRYYEAMQRDPGVIVAHAAATRAIAALRT